MVAETHTLRAILLAIGAGLCWGVGELCTRAVLHTGKVGPLTAIAVRSAVALPVIVLAWVVARYVLGAASEPADFLHAGGKNWALLVLGSGLVAGAAAMILFYASLSQGPISLTKPIAFSLAPATAVLLGWLVLREPMTLPKALGVGLILAGVLVLTMGSHKAAHA